VGRHRGRRRALAAHGRRLIVARGRCLERRYGLRAVAAFEALKGVLVLIAGSGLLLLVHRDVQAISERLVAHLHLDPASRYPRALLRVAAGATSERLRMLAFGALAYAGLRFVEAFGLWRERRWAAWMGVVSGLVYVPFEARALVRRPGLESAIALVLNLAVVLFLARQLQRRR
jgi:uncharacterized membrane protein (DUF2068 family)